MACVFTVVSIHNVESADDDGQWIMPAKDYASTRFSALAEINAGNVRNLKNVWTFSTGLTRGHEAAPLVVGDTMYVVTPWPNLLYAIDLRRGGGLTSASSQGVACCDTVNRGGSYYKGRIYYNTLDMHTVAVDATTGKEAWKVAVGDINRGESLTMAPIVVKGKVLVGNSGGEFGVRGWLAALDADTGKLVWRAYSAGPDKDVLIGANFRPYYEQDRGKDLGVKTWQGEQWKIGGGSVWSWISYDPEVDLIYYGTANPGPWNPEQRPGDNKWTCTLFARRPDPVRPSGLIR
jgi:alcohol dehydrogenase (cytochrome c)